MLVLVFLADGLFSRREGSVTDGKGSMMATSANECTKAVLAQVDLDAGSAYWFDWDTWLVP